MCAVFVEREHLLLRIITDFLNKASHIGSRGLCVFLAHGFTMTSLLYLCTIIFFTKEVVEGMGDLSFLRRDNAWSRTTLFIKIIVPFEFDIGSMDSHGADAYHEVFASIRR